MSSLLAAFLCTGCVFKHSLNYGLIDPEPMIPARISVLPCSVWPKSYLIMGVDNSHSSESLSGFCGVFDSHVVSAFKNQPYMRGFTPRLLSRIHSKNGYQIKALWKTFVKASPKCIGCQDIASFYQESILNNDSWKMALTEFSKRTRLSDAILFPFMVEAKQFEKNTRGIHVTGRSLRVGLLLVSTQTGKIIWFGGKKVFKQNQALSQVSDPKQKQFPPWKLVFKDTLVKELWRDFPGRIH